MRPLASSGLISGSVITAANKMTRNKKKLTPEQKAAKEEAAR